MGSEPLGMRSLICLSAFQINKNLKNKNRFSNFEVVTNTTPISKMGKPKLRALLTLWSSPSMPQLCRFPMDT